MNIEHDKFLHASNCRAHEVARTALETMEHFSLYRDYALYKMDGRKPATPDELNRICSGFYQALKEYEEAMRGVVSGASEAQTEGE